MGYKTIDIFCPNCDGLHIISVWVDSGADLPSVAQCEVCGTQGQRRLSAGILKKEIEEKTHGPQILPNGKAISRTTGFAETRRQLDIKKQLTDARKNGNKEAVIDAAKELAAVKDEAKRKLTGAPKGIE